LLAYVVTWRWPRPPHDEGTSRLHPLLLGSSKTALLLSLLVAASMWFYVQRVLIPFQVADAAAHGQPRGLLSDLYPRWLGARELLLNHRDPYSPEVTREIQIGYYGRALDPNRPEDPKDEQRFAYPVYVTVLLAPTITLPFSFVSAGFGWFLAMLTAASVLLWLRALRWNVSPTTAAVLIVLTLGSFTVAQGIKLQQLSLLVSAMIAGCAMLVVTGDLVAAGILLALATIKPQLVLPLCAWLTLWAASDWRNRKSFVLSFTATLAALFAVGEYLLPGWLTEFAEAVSAYRQYTGDAGSLLDVLVGPFLGKLLAAAVSLAAVAVCWRSRRPESRGEAFSLATALVLGATVVVVPKVAPYNDVLLLPAIFLIVRKGTALWNRDLLTRTCLLVTAALVSWPWLAATILDVLNFADPSLAARASSLPLYATFAMPLAVVAMLWRQVAETQPAASRTNEH
jgi:glycosyl transferase family 87